MIRKAKTYDPEKARESQAAILRKLRETVPALSPDALAALERLQNNVGSADDDELVTSEVQRMMAEIRTVRPRHSGRPPLEREASPPKVIRAPFELLRAMGEL